MYASAVREIPLIEPQPWLAWWGQRFVLFTHGHGLVLTPVGGVTPEGEPRYAVWDIPGRTERPELDLENPSVYYGEGAGSLAYSNVRRMMEFDFPTDEGRAEMRLPADVNAGVPINSLLKRLVFGWQSRQFFDILFSRLIGDETRVHYYRMPLDRVNKVAPFLYVDSDPWAVAVDGGVTWILNGMTTSNRYPYSQLDWIGDKPDERGPIPKDWEEVNYVRDAVKITIDAYSCGLRFYKFADEPVVNTWANVYPTLFRAREEVPAQVQEHLQYPVQLFHLQFDNIYNIYHMKDPMTFFNMEDMWDDSDEVLGPMLAEGKAITFSIEPYHWVVRTGSPLRRARGKRDQFALSMVFTPENALNLRAIPTVYMDGEDYGRILVLQVPKGHYSYGPEQADAAIDQTPEISRQFDWWNRQGMDVIRGHTSTLLIDREVIFVEPVFLRSKQNPVTQLKQVCVVFRGKAAMAPTLGGCGGLGPLRRVRPGPLYLDRRRVGAASPAGVGRSGSHPCSGPRDCHRAALGERLRGRTPTSVSRSRETPLSHCRNHDHGSLRASVRPAHGTRRSVLRAGRDCSWKHVHHRVLLRRGDLERAEQRCNDPVADAISDWTGARGLAGEPESPSNAGIRRVCGHWRRSGRYRESHQPPRGRPGGDRVQPLPAAHGAGCRSLLARYVVRARGEASKRPREPR
jgi:hypothetical protein